MAEMKLFVWEDVLTDYTSGMIVALAPDLETALKMADANSIRPGSFREDMGKVEPEVTLVSTDAEPKFWYVYGGS